MPKQHREWDGRGVGPPGLAVLVMCLQLGVTSCGARSGLLIDGVIALGPGEAGVPVAPVAPLDAAGEATAQDDAGAPFDAAQDALHEVGAPIDAARVSRPVLPPIVEPDAAIAVTDCPDAAATLIYVVTTDNQLLSFYPPTASFHLIGTLNCPAQVNWSPFSMAVDRAGVAYVLFTNTLSLTAGGQSPQGQIFRVSTLTAGCEATAYATGQDGFETFGMGFVGNANGVGEQLFVAGDVHGPNRPNPTLAIIDVGTFVVSPVSDFFPMPLPNAELTGTGDGRLFAFYQQTNSTGIAQVDPASGRVVANDDLSNLPLLGPDNSGGWAFGFWGGDFYLFTTPNGTSAPSVVTRFRPSDTSQTTVATYPSTIVGAGVSTCAPQI